MFENSFDEKCLHPRQGKAYKHFTAVNHPRTLYRLAFSDFTPSQSSLPMIILGHPRNRTLKTT
ncbi:MAG: hypothetical protein WBF90_35150, partial [Rivularia sp. (in: cyanobacteria)]